MGMYDDLSRLDEKPTTRPKSPVKPQEASSPATPTKAIDRTVAPNSATERSNGSPEPTSLLSELTGGLLDDSRPTERYSFEIFTDQKQRIYDVQHDYLTRTGRKLSASRIIRDALEGYLDTLDAVRQPKQ